MVRFCLESGLASCGRVIRTKRLGICTAPEAELWGVLEVAFGLVSGWEVQVEHVMREGNKLADGMVKFVHDSDFLCHRFFDPPDRVLSLLHMDSIE
ncbi:hypothetical protein V6N13_095645 [Hibiscus sabdariffa]